MSSNEIPSMLASPTSEPSPDDLSLEDIQVLEADNQLLRSVRSGKRTVSAALLSPPDSGSSASPVGSSTSVSFKSFNSGSSQTLDVPEYLDSVSTLEIIGLEPPTANAIFSNWARRGNNPDGLMDYVRGHISRLKTTEFRQYTQTEAMVRLGITEKLRKAIMDPRFTDIFGTETLQYWLNDTLRINYLTLDDLRSRLKQQARRSAAKKAKRGSLQGFFAPSESSSHASSQVPDTSVSTNVVPKESGHLPANWIAVQSASSVRPDHVALYKGKAAAEVNDGAFIQQDGSIDMDVLRTHHGGDFNSQHPAWYWTPEPEVAEQYRKWAAERCSYSETWVIRIEVPKTFIDGLRSKDLWYSHDWKEYVWSCRKGKTLPAKFDLYWKSNELLKGHICIGAIKISKIKDTDVQTRITNEDCLRVPETQNEATQWVFMQSSVASRLGVEVRGKIHIDITASNDTQAD